MVKTDSITDKFKQLKTLPHVAMRLVTMISEDKSNAKDFEAVIQFDPVLVMRVFKLVNSAYFALTEKAEVLSDAIVIIGQENLRNIVVVEALKDIYKGKMKTDHFSGHALWRHCVATGICSKMIAEQIFETNGEDAFLCGLIHDVGLMIEFQAEPELIDRMAASLEDGADFISHETMVVGTNHCETGFWLSREWKLPGAVQLGIRDHHTKNDDIDPSSMTGILQLGELIATRSGYVALPEISNNLSMSLVSHLRENIDDYLRIQQELSGEMAKAKEVYNA